MFRLQDVVFMWKDVFISVIKITDRDDDNNFYFIKHLSLNYLSKSKLGYICALCARIYIFKHGLMKWYFFHKCSLYFLSGRASIDLMNNCQKSAGILLIKIVYVTYWDAILIAWASPAKFQENRIVPMLRAAKLWKYSKGIV